MFLGLYERALDLTVNGYLSPNKKAGPLVEKCLKCDAEDAC